MIRQWATYLNVPSPALKYLASQYQQMKVNTQVLQDSTSIVQLCVKIISLLWVEFRLMEEVTKLPCRYFGFMAYWPPTWKPWNCLRIPELNMGRVHPYTSWTWLGQHLQQDIEISLTLTVIKYTSTTIKVSLALSTLTKAINDPSDLLVLLLY